MACNHHNYYRHEFHVQLFHFANRSDTMLPDPANLELQDTPPEEGLVHIQIEL